jgi:hypothetical protein
LDRRGPGMNLWEDTEGKDLQHVFFFFPGGGDFFKTGSHYVAQARFELVLILPQPPKYWDYRSKSLHLAYSMSFDHLPHLAFSGMLFIFCKVFIFWWDLNSASHLLVLHAGLKCCQQVPRVLAFTSQRTSSWGS